MGALWVLSLAFVPMRVHVTDIVEISRKWSEIVYRCLWTCFSPWASFPLWLPSLAPSPFGSPLWLPVLGFPIFVVLFFSTENEKAQAMRAYITIG